MKKIAAIILENDKGEILLYLRDNKPGIPFPDHWDLIGGHVEEGETPEEALVREVKEELDIDLEEYSFYKEYECLSGDAYENIKYIYTGNINLPIEEITLRRRSRCCPRQCHRRQQAPTRNLPAMSSIPRSHRSSTQPAH